MRPTRASQTEACDFPAETEASRERNPPSYCLPGKCIYSVICPHPKACESMRRCLHPEPAGE